MVPHIALSCPPPTAPAGLAALVVEDGSGSRPFFGRLLDGDPVLRDLSDAMHALCAVHGGHPGVLDHAAMRVGDGDAVARWIAQALAGFAAERGHLVQLSAAADPLPSTPGQADTDLAIAGLCHALATIARSDRAGCGLGAAIALVLDWGAIRAVMDAAAARFGVALPAPALPDVQAIAAVAVTPAGERAMRFAAQQLLAQHRGLWDLLEARAAARDAA